MKCFFKIVGIVYILFLMGCSTPHQEQEKTIVPDDILYQGIDDISQRTMQKITDNISSPVEMNALLKKLKVPYDKSYMPNINVSNYSTTHQKAIVLGILGADLGYLNMYGKTDSVTEIPITIKEIAVDLKAGDYFDLESILRLANKKSKSDSLSYLSVYGFNEMEKYLRENKRGNLGALVICGLWVESLYLITHISKKIKTEELVEKIGYQKIMLDNLMLILKNYSSDPEFEVYIKELEKIKTEFIRVKISYELGSPEAIEKDGKLLIIQHEKSIIYMTDITLKKITAVTDLFRNKVVKGTLN